MVTWLAQTMPQEVEAGGGLMVVVVQLAITLGATCGGFLLDRISGHVCRECSCPRDGCHAGLCNNAIGEDIMIPCETGSIERPIQQFYRLFRSSGYGKQAYRNAAFRARIICLIYRNGAD